MISILLPDLRIGGAERVSVDLARELVRRGHSVEFILMQARGELIAELPSGVEVFDLNARQFRNLLAPLSAYLRDRAPAVLIANIWPLTSAAVFTKLLACSRTRIVTVDHCSLSAQYSNQGLLHQMGLRASIALFYPYASARIAVSHGVARDSSALGFLKCESFDVVYNPVPLALPQNEPEEQVEKLWGDWKGHRIITVGTLKRQKNHALLIRAFRRLLDVFDAKLMILGAGDLFEATAELARVEGVSDRVVMPGATSNPVPFYHSADLFVLSSDYEGFGNVVVEALGCGLPVVSTNCPSGPAEILENGRYGRLVPVGDADALAKAMAEALDAKHDRDALRRRAAEFSPERATDQYLRLLFPACSS